MYTDPRDRAAYQREWIARKEGATPPSHNYYAYVNFKCRCDTCREANRVHQADYRARRCAAKATNPDT